MILAVDVGTSSLKAVLYDGQGRVLDASTRRYSFSSPQPGWAEGDPEDWWIAFRAAVADLAGRNCALDQVQAIAFTGQMHTAVLLDDRDQVISPAILWLDRRATRETEDLQQQLRLPPYQLNSTFTLPKLLWLRRHQPQILERTRTILWPKDYLRYRLTGEACTDLTEPGGAALLDWETRAWAPDRLLLVDLESRVLPPIRAAADSGGRLLPEVAGLLGLNPEARVVVGMGDVAALFGAAPAKAGRVTCSLGSSSMVFTPLAAGVPFHDPCHRLHVYPFGPYPMVGGVSSTTGSSLLWGCQKLGSVTAADAGFDDCVREALEVEPGAGGVVFVPFLAGERNPYWNDRLRGGFYGLQLSHDRRHMARAVMEGVAYSLRHFLDLFAESGVPVTELALAGGGAETTGWPQIIADACGRDIAIYAGQETVTRVLYALCQQHLGRAGLDESLLQTFETPALVRHNSLLGGTYDEGYQRYLAFVDFALGQSGPPA